MSQLRFVVIVSMFLILAGCAGRHHEPSSASSSEEGFVPIFNGKNLDGWTYGMMNGRFNKAGVGYQVDPDRGVVYCTEKDGGNLYTVKEYANFILRFEFKLTPNANNG